MSLRNKADYVLFSIAKTSIFRGKYSSHFRVQSQNFSPEQARRPPCARPYPLQQDIRPCHLWIKRVWSPVFKQKTTV